MTDRKINGREWMQDKEDHYRTLLRSASLVVEANYSQLDVEQILRAFGSRAQAFQRQGRPLHHAFKGYPHCLLVGMVGTAAIAPESNTFWPEFWAQLDIRHDAELQQWIGYYFLQDLARSGLRSFADVV